jgi:L-alanine-DL-glutamate epimerase-like enolase superfamily enzyme
MHMPESLWTRIADLPLVVETHALERLAASAGEQERITTLVRLRGRGADGLGEEIGMPEDQAALVAASGTLPLEGEWTLASFIDHLGDVDLWPEPPEWEMARRWRSWAFESAALDLALRQAGLGLPEALDRTPAPVRFVNSLGLGDPPEVATIERRLERYPALRFKLDAQASWSPELIDGVTATGAVDIIDFKGRYGLPVDDETALVAMYDGVLARLDGVILEDPHELPEVEALVAPHARRVSFDAPVATVDDVTGAAFGARIVNIKPSRIGSVRTLLDIYAHSEAEGLQLYGGGMGEIGVGRGQVELLAALFHPDGPNDVAPSAYNMPDLPGGLPRSPLTPPERVTGFRWG